MVYATPHVAVQVRIELTRVHLAVADMAGARTLMREIDELLRRRPGSEPWSARPARCGQARQRTRLGPIGGVGLDHGPASPAAAALHPPVVSVTRARELGLLERLDRSSPATRLGGRAAPEGTASRVRDRAESAAAEHRSRSCSPAASAGSHSPSQAFVLSWILAPGSVHLWCGT